MPIIRQRCEGVLMEPLLSATARSRNFVLDSFVTGIFSEQQGRFQYWTRDLHTRTVFVLPEYHVCKIKSCICFDNPVVNTPSPL